VWEGSGASGWRVARRASPGRLQELEEDLFRQAGMEEAPALLAVHPPPTGAQAAAARAAAGAPAVGEGGDLVNAPLWGAAFCDAGGRDIGATELPAENPFSALEALAAQTGARECLVPSDLARAHPHEAKKLADTLARCGCLATELKAAEWNAQGLEADLARLVRGGTAERYRPVVGRPACRAPVAALIKYCDLVGDQAGQGRWQLHLHDPGRVMRLDAEAQRALHLGAPGRAAARAEAGGGAAGGAAADRFSLEHLVGRARTPAGRRLSRQWIRAPLTDLKEIQARHDAVEALVEDGELRSTLRDAQLRGLPDLDRLVRKLERGRATLADLCQLYRASSRLPVIAGALRNHSGAHADELQRTFADPLDAAHAPDRLQRFEALLEAAVDLERVPEEYVVCPRYSPELEAVAERKDAIEAEVLAAAASAARDLGLTLEKNIKLEWHRFGGQRTRCLRVTAKEEKACRKQLNDSHGAQGESLALST